ncbi:MAG TPA: bifunctional DNA primase/polymerase [Acidimicrobiales bacterium]|nr:bifunctional DNA primase/polymerase [Acidimicrobiales bacterium]
MSAAGDAAAGYARRGWAVFPCHAPAARGCTCGAAGCASPAKHPRSRHGLHDATTDAAAVAAWWRRWPQANVGVRTGGGLVVLDVDPAHGGADSLAALEAAVGPLPATMTVHTGGGGLHLYFAHGHALRNSAGKLGPGLDVRGEGGYVIAPPSRHISGAAYRWSDGAGLAPLPAAIVERLQPRLPQRPSVDPASFRPGPQASAWAAAALAGELDRVATAPVGQRNHTLNRAAFSLGQIVGAGHVDLAEAADLLGRAGEAVGLGPIEVAATVSSGLAAGQRWPRHPPERPASAAARSPRRPPGRAAPEPAEPAAPAGAPVDLASYAEECARRLWLPEGRAVRHWLVTERGIPEDVLATNHIGADPGGEDIARPAGVPGAGPAAVLPATHDGRVSFVEVRPLPGPERRPLVAAGVGSPPIVAIYAPPVPAGPCVVVAGGPMDALAACAGGFRSATVGGCSMPAGAGVVADHLRRLGAPLVLAVGGRPAGRRYEAELAGRLAAAGARVARLRWPAAKADLEGWAAASPSAWPRTLRAALSDAWAAERRPRRLAR